MLSAPISDKAKSLHANRIFAAGSLVPFALVTALFFLWGIPNNLNDVLIRQFMKSFPITRLQAGLVQSAFYLGYFVLAVPSAMFMRRLGYKAGFLAGLILFGSGTFLFWPAALVGRYSFFLFALFVMASGLAFLETASNTFIAMAGPEESSERRLNFSQAFNPLGSIAGALIGTTFIFSGVELTANDVNRLQATHQYEQYIHFETLRIVWPYIVLGAVAYCFALIIWKTPFPALKDGTYDEENDTAVGTKALLLNRHLIATIVTQFFYVGAQVGTWSYFIQYIQDYTGRSEKTAGYFLTGTLVMFGIGRFASAAIMKYVPPARLMGVYSIANIILVAIAVFSPGWIGVWTIFLTSFFMSSMYPTIFAMGLHGLGASSKIGGSLIVMAIIGGAVLTPLMGIISDASKEISLAYAVPLFGYAVIAFYSFFPQTTILATES